MDFLIQEEPKGLGYPAIKDLSLQDKEFPSVSEFKTKGVCLQNWGQSKDSGFCLCLEKCNFVTAAWPACSYPASDLP